MMVLEKAEVARWPRLAGKTAKAADKHIKVRMHAGAPQNCLLYVGAGRAAAMILA